MKGGPISPEAELVDYLYSKFNVAAAYKNHRRFLAKHGTFLLPYSTIKRTMDQFLTQITSDATGASVDLGDLVEYTVKDIARVVKLSIALPKRNRLHS